MGCDQQQLSQQPPLTPTVVEPATPTETPIREHSFGDHQCADVTALHKTRQDLHVLPANQTHTTQRAAVAIAIGTRVEMNAEMPSPCWEERFNPDPDRAKLCRICGAQSFHGAQAVAPRRKRCTGAGTMAIGILTVSSTGDGIKVLQRLARGLKAKTPDGISRA